MPTKKKAAKTRAPKPPKIRAELLVTHRKASIRFFAGEKRVFAHTLVYDTATKTVIHGDGHSIDARQARLARNYDVPLVAIDALTSAASRALFDLAGVAEVE